MKNTMEQQLLTGARALFDSHSLALRYIIKGRLVGLVFGVLAGAIGALTIQRTLSYGFWVGALTSLGSSIADVLYACVGAFGLTMVSDFWLEYQTVISLIGGGFIMILVFYLLIIRSMKKAAAISRATVPKQEAVPA